MQPVAQDSTLCCVDSWLEAPDVRTYVFEAPKGGLEYSAGQYAMFTFRKVSCSWTYRPVHACMHVAARRQQSSRHLHMLGL